MWNDHKRIGVFCFLHLNAVLGVCGSSTLDLHTGGGVPSVAERTDRRTAVLVLAGV